MQCENFIQSYRNRFSFALFFLLCNSSNISIDSQIILYISSRSIAETSQSDGRKFRERVRLLIREAVAISALAGNRAGGFNQPSNQAIREAVRKFGKLTRSSSNAVVRVRKPIIY